MPKAYFESEQLVALAEVFQQAKRILDHRGTTHPVILDAIARRILTLAAEGVPPAIILQEVLPPLSAREAGLPPVSEKDLIIIGPTCEHRSGEE